MKDFGLGGTVFDYNNDGLLDILLINREGPVFYRNQGNSEFVDGTNQALKYSRNCYYTDAAVGDYDGDGDLDIYMTCTSKWYTPDMNPPGTISARNILYKNKGDGTFKNVTKAAGVAADIFNLPWRLEDNSAYSKSVAWGDYDNDGDLDLLVINYQDILIDETYPRYTEGPLRNILFRNNGDETFTDVSEEAGFKSGDWSVGGDFFDFDHDGDLDVFISAEGTSLLYFNNGDGTFRDMTGISGIDDWRYGEAYVLPSPGAIADFTGDHIPDINQPRWNFGINTAKPENALFKNHLGKNNNWLKVKTIGRTSNRMGIGARIEITCSSRSQIREVQLGNGGSQRECAVYFGLGRKKVINSLQITWPSGRRQVMENIPVNQVITLDEDDAAAGKK